jgi:hypothetical protein
VTSDDFAEIRASIYENMDEHAIDWIKLKGELHKDLTVDLGEQFSADGSKDGEKIIFVESRDPITGKILKSKITAYLDTQAPVMSRKGLLETGIQGISYVQGQMTHLEWSAEDKVASSGFKSDINPDFGFRWGVAEAGDCSESSLVSKTDWSSNKSEMDVEWPSDDPLKAFYFCLYVKDRAGNIANLLSQPMSSLWNVIAGDNSQGNGSSVTSNKVRFKYLNNLFIDNDKNIEMTDAYFGVRRVIKAFEKDPSRTIEQSQFNKKSGMNPAAPVVIDSEGYYYMVNGSEVFRISPDQSTITKIVKKSADSPNLRLAIRKYQNVESLLIARTVMMQPNDVTAKDFLLEIPLSKIKDLTTVTAIAMDDAITLYRIAGNGIVPPTSFVVPATVRLSKNDPISASDNEHSLGFISDVVAGENGDIYVATQSDGASRGWGNHTIRRLRPTLEGAFDQTLLASPGQATWVLQLAYKKSSLSSNSHEFLFAARANGTTAIDLTTGVRSSPFPELTSSYVTAVLLVPILNNKDYEIYFASGSSSKLYRYDSNFNLIEALGRDMNDVDVTNALASVLGNPDGLYQDPDKNIYVADSQTGVLQKVNPAGGMDLVFGVYGAKSSFINGYTYRLAGDFQSDKSRKIIYSVMNIGEGTQVFAHDLVTNHAYQLYAAAASGADPNSKYDWSLNSLALIKGNDDKNTLLMSRSWHSAISNDWHTAFTSFIEKIGVSGVTADVNTRSVFAGDVLKGLADVASATTGTVNNSEMIFQTFQGAKIVVDSANNIFSSGNYLAVSRLDQTTSRNFNLKIGGSFAVIEDGNGSTLRHIIFQRGVTLSEAVIDVSPTANPMLTPQIKNLCMPGTTIRGARDIIKDDEGNLLISDSQNARVLKYRIRDASGNLKFSYCN